MYESFELAALLYMTEEDSKRTLHFYVTGGAPTGELLAAICWHCTIVQGQLSTSFASSVAGPQVGFSLLFAQTSWAFQSHSHASAVVQSKPI